MEAGRELDALIAEKVMGGFVSDPDALSDTSEVWYWVHTKSGVLRGEPYQLKVKPVWDHQWHQWKPSSDIEAAWQVIEKMEDHGWMARIGRDIGEWNCRFVRPEDTAGYVYDSSDTAPHAICLASLKALGVEVHG